MKKRKELLKGDMRAECRIVEHLASRPEMKKYTTDHVITGCVPKIFSIRQALRNGR